MSFITLLAFDLDGTALFDDHRTISPRNLDALKNAAAKGVELVPATGRAQGRLPDFLSQLPIRYGITSNGARIVDFSSGETLYKNTMPVSLAKRVLERLKGFRLYWELYSGGCCYADASLESAFKALPLSQDRLAMMAKNRAILENLLGVLEKRGADIEKLNLPFLYPEQQGPVQEILEGIPEIQVVSSLPQNAEINKAGCDKGIALAFLCGRLGVGPEQVLALGDNGNDVAMLRYAGTAAVPANASPSAKAAAQAIPASNEESALALAVEKWVL